MEYGSHSKIQLKELSKKAAAGDAGALYGYLQHQKPGTHLFCRLGSDGKPKLSHKADSSKHVEPSRITQEQAANDFRDVLTNISVRASQTYNEDEDVQQALRYIEGLCDSTDFRSKPVTSTPVTFSDDLLSAVRVLASCWLPTADDRPVPADDPPLRRYHDPQYAHPDEGKVVNWANNPPPGSTLAEARRLKYVPDGTVPAIYMKAARELLDEFDPSVVQMTLHRLAVSDLLVAALTVHLRDLEQESALSSLVEHRATTRRAALSRRAAITRRERR
jgi:hypothetical protein